MSLINYAIFKSLDTLKKIRNFMVAQAQTVKTSSWLRSPKRIRAMSAIFAENGIASFVRNHTKDIIAKIGNLRWMIPALKN